MNGKTKTGNQTCLWRRTFIAKGDTHRRRGIISFFMGHKRWYTRTRGRNISSTTPSSPSCLDWKPWQQKEYLVSRSWHQILPPPPLLFLVFSQFHVSRGDHFVILTIDCHIRWQVCCDIEHITERRDNMRISEDAAQEPPSLRSPFFQRRVQK